MMIIGLLLCHPSLHLALRRGLLSRLPTRPHGRELQATALTVSNERHHHALTTARNTAGLPRGVSLRSVAATLRRSAFSHNYYLSQERSHREHGMSGQSMRSDDSEPNAKRRCLRPEELVCVLRRVLSSSTSFLLLPVCCVCLCVTVCVCV